MPANLTQPYLEAEARYRSAGTTQEKIACLEEMITLLPKHKGTEKMHADLKSRLAKLRKQGEKKGGGPARRGPDITIEKEGAGQMVLLGPPNAGKSALVAAVSNAPVEVADYPFATHKPVPGAMLYEDVRIQLIDMPSISPEFVDPNLPTLVRMADAALICVDLGSPDCLDHADWVIDTLRQERITLISGTVSEAPKMGLKKLPHLFIGTKADSPDAGAALELLAEVTGGIPILPISIHDQASLDRFRKACFDLFGIVRIYSKAPGKEPDRSTPFCLPIGSTLVDFAERVHKDFKDRLSFARVWGEEKFDGQRVAKDYMLLDQDVIELHMK